jgi:uncharacterized protein (DUF302 family)
VTDRFTGGPADYLAAERTFPAWIRTSPALMGFGFDGEHNDFEFRERDGYDTRPSMVDETVQKLEGILQAKGVKLFALVDHSGEAEKAGMKMRPTKLLIFGSPKAGTPLMIASPGIAIDLPLKILVWEDAERKVWVSYNSPDYLQKRHGLPPDLVQKIAVVGALANKAAE